MVNRANVELVIEELRKEPQLWDYNKGHSCIIGFTGKAVFNNYWIGTTEAAEALGLDVNEYAKLFFKGFRNGAAFNTSLPPTVADAILTLQHLIKTGKVEWQYVS